MVSRATRSEASSARSSSMARSKGLRTRSRCLPLLKVLPKGSPGVADACARTLISRRDRLKRAGSSRPRHGPGGRAHRINCRRPPYDDLEIREVIAHLVDEAKIFLVRLARVESQQ